MSARPPREIDSATVEAMVAASGVDANSAELEAIARSLARMQSATAGLLQSRSFDETIGRFYGLLEDDTAERGDR